MISVNIAESARVIGNALQVTRPFTAYSDVSGDNPAVRPRSSIDRQYAAGHNQRKRCDRSLDKGSTSEWALAAWGRGVKSAHC